MLSSFRAFFDKHIHPHESESSDQRRRTNLAAAVLLLEVIQADQVVTADERKALARTLGQRFQLEEAQATELIRLAEREAKDATDLHQFTSLINQHFTAEQKATLVQDLWQVAYEDKILHKHEEHLIRRIADLIHVSHSTFIAAKLSAQK